MPSNKKSKYYGHGDNVEGDKVLLLHQLRIWDKLTSQEENKILKNNFLSDVSRDNYTQSLILKYL